MVDVLVRGVDADDVAALKAAAQADGLSLQAYLADVVHAQVIWLRRQQALTVTAARLAGRPPLTEADRHATTAAVHADADERVPELARSQGI